MDMDELRIYRGKDYVISDHIKIHQASLGEICDYGESDYYSMIYHFVSTPQNMKSQLWDMGIDYTEITSYQLFCSLLYKLSSQEETSILFGDLDFTKFKPMKKKSDNSIVLYQIIDGEEVIIDEHLYETIADYIRKSHAIEKDEKLPINESTKMILIEDDREELFRNKNKKFRSRLKNLISSMINSEGFKYNHSQIWDMKINAFMDSVKRISKIQNANLLLQSGYSGYGISLKDVDKKQLDWLGELD